MSGKTKRKIVWSISASNELRNIIVFIKKNSIQNSQKVKQEVLNKITALTDNPERYPADKFKLLNTNNNFRAFELHKIRVSYFVDASQIMIIRVRHVKQEPLFY
ncbi:MAG: type II toxin-antitoxin system RelE/ParE family toxin [Parafilimonas sp.]